MHQPPRSMCAAGILALVFHLSEDAGAQPAPSGQPPVPSATAAAPNAPPPTVSPAPPASTHETPGGAARGPAPTAPAAAPLPPAAAQPPGVSQRPVDGAVEAPQSGMAPEVTATSKDPLPPGTFPSGEAAPSSTGVAPLSPPPATVTTPAATSTSTGGSTDDLPPNEHSAAPEPAEDDSGPVIELAEEHHAEAPAPNGEESLSARRASASVFSGLPGDYDTTTIGGYAQFQLTSVRRGFDSPFDTSATIRRLVLLFTHQVTDEVTAYTELEWENAIACATCSGSVEIEQAYVDWRLYGDALTLRSGLVLIPIGLLNLWHEPPVFHGVDRPQLEQVLIPTTWRELGAGFTGLLSDKLEYQLYVTTTLVPSRLGPNGFVAARQLGSNALSKAGALSARVDYEPILGLSFSGSLFASDAGGNGDYYNSDGERVDFTFPIVGGSLTGRFNRRGWEARTVGAAFWMPEAGALMNARRPDGGLLFPNVDRTGAVPTRMMGGLVEVAYDVLRFFDTSHQLLPFVRAEAYDTQSAVPSAFVPNRAFTVEEWTMGLTYRPIRQLVFKSDVQLRDRRSGLDELQLNFGMGYML